MNSFPAVWGHPADDENASNVFHGLPPHSKVFCHLLQLASAPVI